MKGEKGEERKKSNAIIIYPKVCEEAERTNDVSKIIIKEGKMGEKSEDEGKRNWHKKEKITPLNCVSEEGGANDGINDASKRIDYKRK